METSNQRALGSEKMPWPGSMGEHGADQAAEARALGAGTKNNSATSDHARQDSIVSSTMQAPASCPFTHCKCTDVFVYPVERMCGGIT